VNYESTASTNGGRERVAAKPTKHAWTWDVAPVYAMLLISAIGECFESILVARARCNGDGDGEDCVCRQPVDYAVVVESVRGADGLEDARVDDRDEETLRGEVEGPGHAVMAAVTSHRERMPRYRIASSIEARLVRCRLTAICSVYMDRSRPD